MRSRLLSKAKTKIVRGGRRTYIVPIGLYRGLKLELDLRSDVQVLTGLFELETHRYIKKWSDYVAKIAIVERRIGARRTAAGELRLDDFELLLGTAPGIIKIDVDGCEIEHCSSALLQRSF